MKVVIMQHGAVATVATDAMCGNRGRIVQALNCPPIFSGLAHAAVPRVCVSDTMVRVALSAKIRECRVRHLLARWTT